MRPTLRAPVAIALAAALAGMACNKEPTSPSLSLSLEELGTLVTELGNVMSVGTSVALPAPPIRRIGLAWTRLAAAATPFNASWSCPAGGTASIASTFDTSATAMSGDATLSYASCKTAHYTTSGAIHATGADTLAQTSEALHLSATGTLDVTTLDGRSGACPIDLTMIAHVVGSATPVYQVTGSACGVSLTGSY